MGPTGDDALAAKFFFPRANLPQAVVAATVLLGGGAHAQTIKVDSYYELESKYLFGFLDGTDIGAEGEKEIEIESTAGFQKRQGRYSSLEQELEYEGVPSQYWDYELSAHGLSQQIHGVQGFDNLSQTTFSGISLKPKWLLIGRGPGNPIGVSLSIQPQWGRIDGESGEHTTDFSMETRLALDTELIENRFYAAFNLFYTPEMARIATDPSWDHFSELGVGAGLAYRVAPKVTLGGEVEYDMLYEGLGFNQYDGGALYVGPSLHIQFNPKIMLALAWQTQVGGHEVGQPGALALNGFERNRINLKTGYEF